MTVPSLTVHNLTARIGNKVLLDDLHFQIDQGANWAIVGDSGSGKTTLIKALAGQLYFSGHIKFSPSPKGKPHIVVISRQHRFKTLSNTANFYYQQRFNSNDAEDTFVVMDALKETGATETQIQEVLKKLGIQHIRSSRLIQLSNGEHKRFQLADALLQNADWILLDNPYIGLDVEARSMLNEMLDSLVQSGIQIILFTSANTLPKCITHVGMLEKGKLDSILTKSEYQVNLNFVEPNLQFSLDIEALKQIPTAFLDTTFSTALKLVDVNVAYNGKKILNGIHWEVKRGECWQLSGHNGSGKSTLLSLVNGDNPQAFANEIYLFDQRKGMGESIWDIKQKIGYISPELHHYFDTGSNCFEIVASGLFDTIGLFKKLNEAQQKMTEQWMHLLKVNAFSNQLFHTLSDGEQRLVLLARTLVKNPPLLILDEPCQGLDDATANAFRALIHEVCVHLGKTLIYVSHYDQDIPACVTKKLVLEHGSIVM